MNACDTGGRKQQLVNSEANLAPVPVHTAAQVQRTVDIMVGAFYDDPVWSWAFPDQTRRRDQQRQLWRLYVEGATRYPSVWLNAGETAAAVWIPPGGTDLSSDQEAQVEPLLTALLGSDGAIRVLASEEAFADAHPRDVEHYYLSLLGTDAAHRGHGYGLALLEDNLDRIDGQDAAAYLEASNPGNVALYERYGFRRRSVFTLPYGGPDVSTMWRERRSERHRTDGRAA